jgi:hypothetical protein
MTTFYLSLSYWLCSQLLPQGLLLGSYDDLPYLDIPNVLDVAGLLLNYAFYEPDIYISGVLLVLMRREL